MISCATSNEPSKKEIDFRSFYEKFNPLELPLKYDGKNGFDKNVKTNPLDSYSNDSLFINFYGSPTIALGSYKDTSDFYTLIYYYIGDSFYFWVTTFDKSFNKISDTLILSKEGCMPTICLECNTVINFSNDFTINCIDTMNYLECDELGNSTDEIAKSEILMKKLTIDKKGEITITETKNCP
jgi:hypothetical protein